MNFQHSVEKPVARDVCTLVSMIVTFVPPSLPAGQVVASVVGGAILILSKSSTNEMVQASWFKRAKQGTDDRNLIGALKLLALSWSTFWSTDTFQSVSVSLGVPLFWSFKVSIASNRWDVRHLTLTSIHNAKLMLWVVRNLEYIPLAKVWQTLETVCALFDALTI